MGAIDFGRQGAAVAVDIFLPVSDSVVHTLLAYNSLTYWLKDLSCDSKVPSYKPAEDKIKKK